PYRQLDFFFPSRRRHTSSKRDWSSDVCSSDLLEENKPSGSEDATFFITRVQECGGQASYCIFGTDLAAGHHNEKFDVNEDSMLSAVQTLFETAKLLSEKQ